MFAQKKIEADAPHFGSATIYKTGEEYEITKVDITAIPNINALKVAVKGVKLGDTKDFVIKNLGHPDEINEMGIYFYKDKSAPLFAVVFDNEDTVRRLVLFPALSKYAVGNTKKLLSHQIATDDELRYFLLGVEDEKIKSPTGRITFKYLKEGFEFSYLKIGSDMEDFIFFLKLPAKVRH
ncbi:MAG: hypothetical protein OHK0040_13950 [bacterium]